MAEHTVTGIRYDIGRRSTLSQVLLFLAVIALVRNENFDELLTRNKELVKRFRLQDIEFDNARITYWGLTARIGFLYEETDESGFVVALVLDGLNKGPRSKDVFIEVDSIPGLDANMIDKLDDLYNRRLRLR